MPMIRVFVPQEDVERDDTLKRILGRFERGTHADQSMVALAKYVGNRLTFDFQSTATSS
jgi:hypothetical protein